MRTNRHITKLIVFFFFNFANASESVHIRLRRILSVG